MQFIYILSLCISILTSPTLVAKVAININWQNYTNEQLLKQKERLKNQPDLLRGLEEELARRGIVATVTLAQAPAGKEWVLQDKTLLLERRAGGPTTPPPGAGAGEWFFVTPNWLYFEKASGNILDTTGTIVGRIGAIETTSTARSGLPSEKELLQARLKALEQDEAPTAPEGEIPAVPGFEEAPEAPDFGGPEAPPFEGPEAPEFEGLPGAPTGPKKSKGPAPLMSDEMNSLTPEQKNVSDQLVVDTIKNIATLFSRNLNNEPYITIIKKQLDLLRANKDFYKRAELDELSNKGITNCFQDKTLKSIDAPSITACLKAAVATCLFNNQISSSFDSQMQEIAEIMTTTSDELFKIAIKQCTKKFPPTKDLTSQSYTKLVQDIFRELEKNKNFHKKGNHTFAIKNLTQALQDNEYDPQDPQAYLTIFNTEKEAYFNAWIDACRQSLYDTTPDADFENDIGWLISLVVAAGRGERDIKKSVTSNVLQQISDTVLVNLFIESNPEAATVEDTWLPALRDLLTDPQFLKPEGLMITYGESAGFSAKAIYQPIMQILTQPASKTIKDHSLAFINSVKEYLLFERDSMGAKLQQSKDVLNEILLKPRREVVSKKPKLEKVPATLAEYFDQNAFANKTLVQVLQVLEKIKTQPQALQSAITLMKTKPEDSETIIKLLAAAGLSASQTADIQTVLGNSQKQIALLTYLLRYIQEYEQQAKKNPAYKNGKQLYHFIKDTIQDKPLIRVFESVDREADMIYSALTKYLNSIPNTFAKDVKAARFRKTIEPYGILIGSLKAFNADMQSPATQTKALAKFINALTALNTGKLSVGTDYPDIINASKDSIENQQLYVGQLDALLNALKKNDFASFIKALDEFVAAAETIAQKLPDGTITRSAEYAQLINEFQQFEATLVLNDIKTIIEAINTGNYTALPRFEDSSFATLQARAALVGSLTPLIDWLKKTRTIDRDAYKKAYEELIASPAFLQKSKISSATKNLLKESLKEVLNQTAERIKSLKPGQAMPSAPLTQDQPEVPLTPGETPEAPAWSEPVVEGVD